MRRTLIILLTMAGLGVLAASASPSSEVSPTTLVVDMLEFRFRPAVIRLQVGRPATLRLVNRGQLAHQIQTDAFRHLPMTIVGEASYVEAPGLEVLRLQPGGAETLRFTPRVRGRVRFACTIEGHQEAGMAGVIEVR